jgi:hypothetical protein
MIEDLLAPLAPREPTDAEIARLLARADARRRRRRIRVATGAALATAAATAALAALPARDDVPLTAGSLLQTTAAIAAEQPGPAAWTGFRYIQQVWRSEHGAVTIERTEEQWTDSRWQGRRTSPQAKVVEGALPPAGAAAELPADVRREIARRPAHLSERARAAIRAQFAQVDPKYLLGARDLRTPRDMPNLYGDAALARVPLSELPTDPKALAALLLAAHEDGRWTLAGGWNPLPASIKYDVLRDVLTLLTIANTTAQQRAALITVLTNYEGVAALEAVQDRRGREGHGVDIPSGHGPVRVIFDPGTSELLEWSQPGETHTFLKTGHVARLGERP